MASALKVLERRAQDLEQGQWLLTLGGWHEAAWMDAMGVKHDPTAQRAADIR